MEPSKQLDPFAGALGQKPGAGDGLEPFVTAGVLRRTRRGAIEGFELLPDSERKSQAARLSKMSGESLDVTRGDLKDSVGF